MHVTFLGTGGALPTIERNPSAILLDLDGDRLLFDVGEGTQRQMAHFSTGFDVSTIFISHLHGDHVLGVPGLLETLDRQGRTGPLSIYTPRGTMAGMQELTSVADVDPAFPVQVTGVDPGHTVDGSNYTVRVFETDHGTRSRGYAIVVEDETSAGTERRIVYTGDTRPSETTVSAASDAELLIHDAMFASEHGDRASETGHSTVPEAATIARRADVERLALTHVSSRYGDDIAPLEREADEEFGAGAFIPDDGRSVHLPEGRKVDH